jgi:hypothetical protein
VDIVYNRPCLHGAGDVELGRPNPNMYLSASREKRKAR